MAAYNEAYSSVPALVLSGAASGFSAGLVSSNGNLKTAFQGAITGAATGAFD